MQRQKVIAGTVLVLLNIILDIINVIAINNYNNTIFRINHGIFIGFYIYFGVPMLIVGYTINYINVYLIYQTTAQPLAPLIILSISHFVNYRIATIIRKFISSANNSHINSRMVLEFIGLLSIMLLVNFFGFQAISPGPFSTQVILLSMIAFFSSVSSILLHTPILIGIFDYFSDEKLVKNPLFQRYGKRENSKEIGIGLFATLLIALFILYFLPQSLSFVMVIFIPSMILTASYGIRTGFSWNFITTTSLLTLSPFILQNLNNLEATMSYQMEVIFGSLTVILLGIYYSSSAYEKYQKELVEEDLRYLQKIETIDNLAGGVSHDMANFIQILFGYFDLLEIKGHEYNDEAITEAILNMRNTTQRASNLAKQMLTISKRRFGSFEQVNLNTFLIEYATILEKMVDASHKIEWTLGDNIPFVTIDKDQIQQVILNLVLNAKEAMPNGGKMKISTSTLTIEREKRLIFFGVPRGEYVILSITDEGHGIAEEEKARIFEPFYSKKPISEGNGLGLTMVLSIIRKHKAFIDIESSPSGTNFMILFDPHPDLIITNNANDHTDLKEELPTIKKILIIDDEIEIANSIKRHFVKLGVNVDVRQSGLNLLDTIDISELDLLILDIIMPDISGLEIAQQIREISTKLPILLISGYPANYFKNFDLENSTFGFLHKPFNFTDLNLSIKEAILKAENVVL